MLYLTAEPLSLAGAGVHGWDALEPTEVCPMSETDREAGLCRLDGEWFVLWRQGETCADSQDVFSRSWKLTCWSLQFG